MKRGKESVWVFITRAGYIKGFKTDGFTVAGATIFQQLTYTHNEKEAMTIKGTFDKAEGAAMIISLLFTVSVLPKEKHI